LPRLAVSCPEVWVRRPAPLRNGTQTAFPVWFPVQHGRRRRMRYRRRVRRRAALFVVPCDERAGHGGTALSSFVSTRHAEHLSKGGYGANGIIAESCEWRRADERLDPIDALPVATGDGATRRYELQLAHAAEWKCPEPALAPATGAQSAGTPTSSTPFRKRQTGAASRPAFSRAPLLSLRRLAKTLGVSVTAPYAHFASKADLLAVLAARYVSGSHGSRAPT
jgi:hypothetical protein